MSDHDPSRRTVLRGGMAALATALLPAGLAGCAAGPDATDAPVTGTDAETDGPITPPRLRSLIDQLGPLGEADDLGLRLPPGFSARIVARTGVEVLPGGHAWHIAPDGGACFALADGGWVYVSNAEVAGFGGVGALRFDASGTLVDAYPILEGTNVNCAGGPTPWGTWLSCEEVDRGRVFECDPHGERDAVEVPSLGRFKHEAAAVDPVHGAVYLSEDEGDGRFYRYVAASHDADGHLSLDEGTLEVARVDDEGGVTWLPVPDPLASGEVPTRLQVEDSTVFRGGEGLWWHEGIVYLATKGDNRIWAYDTDTEQISVIYDRALESEPMALKGVDNVTVTACGDVLVAEDGGFLRVMAVLPSGEVVPVLQIEGQDESEITGPAFDPSGTRLYVSSQRATGALGGITYEITGPFHEPMGDEETCA